jgi:hypothetical protein
MENLLNTVRTILFKLEEDPIKYSAYGYFYDERPVNCKTSSLFYKVEKDKDYYRMFVIQESSKYYLTLNGPGLQELRVDLNESEFLEFSYRFNQVKKSAENAAIATYSTLFDNEF